MSRFTTDQVDVLRRLKSVLADVPFCLVGACAIDCHLDRYWRRTNDLDLSVSIGADALQARLAAFPELRPDPKQEQRWEAPGGVKVDILPVNPEAISAGAIVWPKTQFRMSVVGFRLALERRQPIAIAPDLTIDVAPLPAVALLKMVAYQDRPHDRERDLEDIGHLLEEYLAPDDERRFSEAAIDAQVSYELVSAFTLGRELRGIANESERERIAAFIDLVRQADDASGTQARMARVGPRSWHQDPDELLLRIGAFEDGLG